MPHALLRVLASTSIASATVLVALPPSAQAQTQAHTQVRVQPVPAVQEPPAAAVSVPTRPSLAVRPAGTRRVGPGEPEVTTPAGPRLVDEITSEAASVQEEQGFGRQAPDVRSVLPDTADAEPLTLIKPLAPILKAFDGLGGLGKVVPGLTYRLCVQSEAVPVSCSISQPVATPAVADVTG
ncbi:hypothetical protein AB0392_55030, partial [Nonomuraea angiospora]